MIAELEAHQLPLDVTRCGSRACPSAGTCARRQDMKPEQEYWMSYLLPQDGSSCGDFIQWLKIL